MAGHYAQLIDTDQVGKVTRMFEDAIALSFVTNPMRTVTQAEVKRRFNLCDKIFTTLRADLHWSVPKIEDVLSTYLKCELDGVPYSPESVGDRWNPEAVTQLDVPQALPIVLVDSHGMPLTAAELAALDESAQSSDTVQRSPAHEDTDAEVEFC